MKRTALAVALVLVVASASMMAYTQGRRGEPDKKIERVEKAKDPVCGIMVDKDPSLSANYRGEVYYFCSKADMEKFKKEPEAYVGKKR